MKRSNKKLGFLALTAVVFIGTYNAVVINSQSHIAGLNFQSKRLDEMLGMTTPGRKAASLNFNGEAAAPQAIVEKTQIQAPASVVTTAPTAPESTPAQAETASIQEDMNLSLIEVINAKIWKQGLKNDQFSGSLLANNGVIESLNVTLPDGGFSVSFAEMTGNVFEYDYNGEVYTGMMYQVDPTSYMVTLSNGPLAGTRFKFMKVLDEADQSMPDMPSNEYVAEKEEKELEVGNFGDENLEPNLQAEEAPATNDHMQANSFNMSEEASVIN